MGTLAVGVVLTGSRGRDPPAVWTPCCSVRCPLLWTLSIHCQALRVWIDRGCSLSPPFLGLQTQAKGAEVSTDHLKLFLSRRRWQVSLAGPCFCAFHLFILRPPVSSSAIVYQVPSHPAPLSYLLFILSGPSFPPTPLPAAAPDPQPTLSLFLQNCGGLSGLILVSVSSAPRSATSVTWCCAPSPSCCGPPQSGCGWLCPEDHPPVGGSRPPLTLKKRSWRSCPQCPDHCSPSSRAPACP